MQLQLAEYETTAGVRLTSEQRDQLRRLAPSVAVQPTIGADALYDLTPGSSVGIVHLSDGLEVVIRPKLPIDRVLFLVSYAISRGAWQAMPAALASADSLLEAIIPGYTYQLRRALERGVLQGYRSVDDGLQTVRGRWRIGDQVRNHFGIAPPVEVTYDDYTEDIEVNRLLRAASHRLVRLPTRDDRVRWPLRALDAKLEGVELIDYDPRKVPQPAFDRLNERYRPAIELARLILAWTSFDLAEGRTGASAFLIDMNAVFEDFVVVALREALKVSDRVLVQGASGHAMRFDVSGHVPLKPDVSLWLGGRCVFVGDVKYKRVFSDSYPNADLYQLTAYAIASGLGSGTLIYASAERETAAYEIVRIGKHLQLVALDLRQPPRIVLGQIAAVAGRILDSARQAA